MNERIRQGRVNRNTKETDIEICWVLDGDGNSDVNSGIGFFDHMITALAKHGQFDITLACQGDLDVDGHHTVEDVGICLGQAFAQGIGSGQGISRFGSAFVPMEEALVHAAVDISGRPYLQADMNFPQTQVGQFDSYLTLDFFRALTVNAGITLHLRQICGDNSHHIIEAAFKAVAQALRQASTENKTIKGALSTKGSLDLGRNES